MPAPEPGKRYMLYAHVPFCERLCPYCSFNRFPFAEDRAKPYFANLRKEMLMLADLGYDFDSLYIGGGTPTIMIDELCETIDLARDHVQHQGSVQRDQPEPSRARIHRQAGRPRAAAFRGGAELRRRPAEADGPLREVRLGPRDSSSASSRLRPHFVSMNADMIFNFPAQTVDVLISRHRDAWWSQALAQTTFYPLMASRQSVQKLAGRARSARVDYSARAAASTR